MHEARQIRERQNGSGYGLVNGQWSMVNDDESISLDASPASPPL